MTILGLVLLHMLQKGRWCDILIGSGYNVLIY